MAMGFLNKNSYLEVKAPAISRYATGGGVSMLNKNVVVTQPTPPTPPATDSFWCVDGSNRLYGAQNIQTGWSVYTSISSDYVPMYQMNYTPIYANGKLYCLVQKVSDGSLWIAESSDSGLTWTYISWENDARLFFANGLFISTRNNDFIFSSDLSVWTPGGGALFVNTLHDIKFNNGFYHMIVNAGDNYLLYGITDDLTADFIFTYYAVFSGGHYHYWTIVCVDVNPILISGSSLFFILRDYTETENYIYIFRAAPDDESDPVLVKEIALSLENYPSVGGNPGACIGNLIAYCVSNQTDRLHYYLITSTNGGSTFSDLIDLETLLESGEIISATLVSDGTAFYVAYMTPSLSVVWMRSTNLINWTITNPLLPEGMLLPLQICKKL
jgi:hypothetical protein